MKVLRGRVSDADRMILTESNRTGRVVLAATLHGCVTRDDRGSVGCQEPMQAVGVCTGWNHESFQIGGFSFETNVPWLSAVRVWWRDEAPEKEQVEALLAEQMELREAERDAAFKSWAVTKFLLTHDDAGNKIAIHENEPDDPILAAAERFKQAVWSELGLSIQALEQHGRKNLQRIIGRGAA